MRVTPKMSVVSSAATPSFSCHSPLLWLSGLYADCQKPQIHSLLASGFCHRCFFKVIFFFSPEEIHRNHLPPTPVERRGKILKCSPTHARTRAAS